jgi:hypothetical protein
MTLYFVKIHKIMKGKFFYYLLFNLALHFGENVILGKISRYAVGQLKCSVAQLLER